MANNPLETTLLDKAVAYAVKAHAGTERRGKGYPYIVHPLEAVSIVASITPDQELLAAVALHDVVEDCNCSVSELRTVFGNRVADLVSDESEEKITHLSESESWRMRKEAAINHLANASLDAKIVAMGDKLSNMRAIAADYEQLGDKLWQRFHAPNGKPDHEWHYRKLAEALSDLSNTRAYKEFCYHINTVFNAQ